MDKCVLPVDIFEAPLQQYCEVHFSGHDHYRSIELQRLAISPSRAGYVVLLNTNDGVLDVLAESALGIDEQWCRNDPSVSSYRLGKIEPIELDSVRLQTGADGVDAQVAFQDSAGRRVEMTVRTPPSGPGKSRKLFVPGVPRSNARMLWFLYVFEFGPLRPSDQIEIRIDGVPMTPKKWPWPMGLRKHIQGRFANDIAFFSLNPPRLGSITPEDLSQCRELETSAADNGRALLVDCRRKPLIGKHEVVTRFDPPISAINQQGYAQAGNGAFTVTIDSIQVAQGRYEVSTAPDQSTVVRLSDVNQNWRPPEKDFSVWMLEFYHRLKMGKRRWHWEGTFRAGDDGVVCEGAWRLG